METTLNKSRIEVGFVGTVIDIKWLSKGQNDLAATSGRVRVLDQAKYIEVGQPNYDLFLIFKDSDTLASVSEISEHPSSGITTLDGQAFNFNRGDNNTVTLDSLKDLMLNKTIALLDLKTDHTRTFGEDNHFADIFVFAQQQGKGATVVGDLLHKDALLEAKPEFKNIPTAMFESSDTQHERERHLVQFNKKAWFEINDFSIIQFLHGYPLNTGSISTREHEISAKLLHKIALCTITNNTVEEGQKKRFELVRDEVKMLRAWLEARMHHCEKERDDRVYVNAEGHKGSVSIEDTNKPLFNETWKPVFNPDTYIAMKYLLLDIREWLLGDILD